MSEWMNTFTTEPVGWPVGGEWFRGTSEAWLSDVVLEDVVGDAVHPSRPLLDAQSLAERPLHLELQLDEQSLVTLTWRRLQQLSLERRVNCQNNMHISI